MRIKIDPETNLPVLPENLTWEIQEWFGWELSLLEEYTFTNDDGIEDTATQWVGRRNIATKREVITTKRTQKVAKSMLRRFLKGREEERIRIEKEEADKAKGPSKGPSKWTLWREARIAKRHEKDRLKWLKAVEQGVVRELEVARLNAEKVGTYPPKRLEDRN